MCTYILCHTCHTCAYVTLAHLHEHLCAHQQTFSSRRCMHTLRPIVLHHTYASAMYMYNMYVDASRAVVLGICNMVYFFSSGSCTDWLMNRENWLFAQTLSLYGYV